MKFNILILMMVMIFITSCNIETSYPKADWTLIFYLADDYQTLNLTNDILELTQNEVSTKNIRLVLLYDGPNTGDSKLEVLDSPFTMNSRVIPLQNTNISTGTNGELDMADQKTLESYITYVKEKLPADKYALYFGSHGTGFTSYYPSGLAVENDSTNIDEQLLTISEIADATYNTDGMDLITFDACNIGNIETIYEFKDSAKYIIASPELIPGPGNDYIGFVKAAYGLTDLSTLSLGKATLKAYYDYYSLPDNERSMGSPYYHDAKSVQQLYNVAQIVEIADSSSFKVELLSFINNNTSDVTKFNYYYKFSYSDIYDLISDSTQLDNAITIAEGGIYKWISIYTYMPANSDESINSYYKNSKFAKNNAPWLDLVTNQ